MLVQRVTLSFAFLSVTFHYALSEKILGLFPHFSKSHALVHLPLMEALASRGHNVTVLSSFNPKNVTNYNSIDIPPIKNGFYNASALEGHYYKVGGDLSRLLKIRHHYTSVVRLPQVQALQYEHFDLVILELFNTQLFLGLVHKINAPFIFFHTTEPFPFHRSIMGDSQPSYYPHVLSDLPRTPTFWTRLVNTAEIYGPIAYYQYLVKSRSHGEAEDSFGSGIPSVDDISRNASLYFVNRHFSLSGVQSKSQSTVEVGGIHIKPKNPLPENIRQIMDSATDGVIYFSMGAQLPSSSFSKHKINLFLRVFAGLKQTVFWKFEDKVQNKSKNVHLAPWFPQRDMLAHPRIVLFISHCGTLGLHEAVTEAVPLLCLPMCADQQFNSRTVQSKGFGDRLDSTFLSENHLRNSIDELIRSSSYKKNAVQISKTFKDRPLSAMDTAIFWTEYVLRHRGAFHLRSPTRLMTWYEYRDIDVWATLILIVLAFVKLFISLLKWLFAPKPHKIKNN